jgi:hypothetical protein
MRGMMRTVAIGRAFAVVAKVPAVLCGVVALVLACGYVQAAVAQTAAAPIRLRVDASQAPQKILHVHMEIPVSGGPVTLYYPEWIPGEHMPDGPIIQVAGMKFSGGGKTIAWRRDLVEMFSIHVDVPEPGADVSEGPSCEGYYFCAEPAVAH